MQNSEATGDKPDYSGWKAITAADRTVEIDHAYGLIVKAFACSGGNLDQELLHWHAGEIARLVELVFTFVKEIAITDGVISIKLPFALQRRPASS